jgi:flagellar biosynthesis regulator FlaF
MSHSVTDRAHFEKHNPSKTPAFFSALKTLHNNAAKTVCDTFLKTVRYPDREEPEHARSNAGHIRVALTQMMRDRAWPLDLKNNGFPTYVLVLNCHGEYVVLHSDTDDSLPSSFMQAAKSCQHVNFSNAISEMLQEVRSSIKLSSSIPDDEKWLPGHTHLMLIGYYSLPTHCQPADAFFEVRLTRVAFPLCGENDKLSVCDSLRCINSDGVYIKSKHGVSEDVDASKEFAPWITPENTYYAVHMQISMAQHFSNQAAFIDLDKAARLKDTQSVDKCRMCSLRVDKIEQMNTKMHELRKVCDEEKTRLTKEIDVLKETAAQSQKVLDNFNAVATANEVACQLLEDERLSETASTRRKNTKNRGKPKQQSAESKALHTERQAHEVTQKRCEDLQQLLDQCEAKHRQEIDGLKSERLRLEQLCEDAKDEIKRSKDNELLSRNQVVQLTEEKDHSRASLASMELYLEEQRIKAAELESQIESVRRLIDAKERESRLDNERLKDELFKKDEEMALLKARHSVANVSCSVLVRELVCEDASRTKTHSVKTTPRQSRTSKVKTSTSNNSTTQSCKSVSSEHGTDTPESPDKEHSKQTTAIVVADTKNDSHHDKARPERNAGASRTAQSACLVDSRRSTAGWTHQSFYNGPPHGYMHQPHYNHQQSDQYYGTPYAYSAHQQMFDQAQPSALHVASLLASASPEKLQWLSSMLN